MPELFLGLISGTSRDGIDAALAEFSSGRLRLVDSRSLRYPAPVSEALDLMVQSPRAISLDEYGHLHAAIGDCFAEAAVKLLAKASVDPAAVRAIGSHGQTVRHSPRGPKAFSLQIGDPARIAAATGIDTVADFRSADIASGGQGAPLVPPFHRYAFAERDARVAVVNIGGIANVTLLNGEDDPIGFDTGPGNTLMDLWIREQRGQPYDDRGRWAASAAADDALLEDMLGDAYFAATGPKSTGFEYFNRDWLGRFDSSDPAVVQATLLELTARTIADALSDFAPERVYVCGGGARNSRLVERLADRLQIDVATTAERGIDPDWVEAVAFAWLAREHLAGRPGNAPSVTGAKRARILGAMYPAGVRPGKAL